MINAISETQIVEIQGRSILENVTVNAQYIGKYAAYQAYLFYMKNLSIDSVKVHINGYSVGFHEFSKIAEMQSAHHADNVIKSAKELILA